MGYELIRTGPWSCYRFSAVDEAGVCAGFMTRSSQEILDDPGARASFLAALSASDMIVLNQVHGSEVHVVRKGGRPASGDGLVLPEPGVVGIIKTADCLPVVLYAKDGGACAILHAGWRGTVSGITRKAIAALSGLGCSPERLGALIGPGIGRCCYNVGMDVVAAFREAGFGGGIFETRGARTFLDLRMANREVLEAEGVSPIEDVDICTSCRPDLFFSARRDASRDRQVSFVLLKAPGGKEAGG